MARITININAEGEENDQELITLDVPLDLNIGAFKGMIESETKIAVASQHIFLNGEQLKNDNQTLEEASIKDGEMLAVIVSKAPRQQSGPSRQAPARNQIEHIRQQILNSPEQLAALLHQNPELAHHINDPEQFRRRWEAMQQMGLNERQQRQNEIRLLNEDPFNADYQKRIADIIRREKIEENLQYAYENNPAVFVQVTMLYVPVLVNGHPVKAFVDSGAQSTIMSPGCAEACGIRHLIDERYSGIARGVGTAKILGKVHQAKIQVGDAELDCAFTVMEGKSVDLLFGLDMLKRHQACIDLLNNKLRFPHTEVEFLPESDIPQNEEQKMLDEPTVEGPNGTEIGANTGTVRPKGTAKAAHESLEKAKVPAKGPANSAGSANASSPKLGVAGSSSAAAGAQSTSTFPEKDIATLMNLGITREQAISALDKTGGDVEFAAGLLF